MSLSIKIRNLLTKKIMLALTLIAALCLGHTIHPAQPQAPCSCVGDPGDLAPFQNYATDDAQLSSVNALASYECVIYGELRCFVVTGGASDSNAVYRVAPGGRLDIQQVYTKDTIFDVASFKCNGTCYVLTIEEDQYDRNLIVYEVDSSNGNLISPSSTATTAQKLDTFVCNGVCYVITGGQGTVDSNTSANLLYTFTNGTIETPAIQNYDPDNDITAITTFECEGKWWVVTGSTTANGSRLYMLDPCANYPDQTLMLVQSSFRNEPINDLVSFFWNCKWYVAGVDGGDEGGFLFNYVLDSSAAQLTLVDAILLAGGIAEGQVITSLACGCKCYVITGGDPLVNAVFELDTNGLFGGVQPNYNSNTILALTAYDCCDCFVVSGGNTPYINLSNLVYEMHNPQVVANDDCFCFLETDVVNPTVIDVFANDCGCFDRTTIRFFADEELTMELPAYSPNTPGGGTVFFDTYDNTVKYSHPGSDTLVTDCFYYTLEDCCNCFDSAKVTIYIKPVCDIDISVVPANALCMGPGNLTIIVTAGTPPYTFTISPDPNNVSPIIGQSPQTFTNLSPDTYLVTVTDTEGCATCEVVDITLAETSPQIVPSSSETSFCSTDTVPFTLTTNPLSPGGTWLIDGMVADGYNGLADIGGGNAEFNAANAGAGFHTITYEFGYFCSDDLDLCVIDCGSGSGLDISLDVVEGEIEGETYDSVTLCNGTLFCYQVTIMNNTGSNVNDPILVTGIIDPSWNVLSVDNCGGQPYIEAGPGEWVEPVTFNVFNENMNNGTWTIQAGLGNGESICLGICIENMPEGTFDLNLEVSV